jgi:hypothetical protein
MAKYMSSGHVYPRAIWLCLCLRLQNPGSRCQSDWDVLHQNSLMFNNPVPLFDVPTYWVHCNCGAHVTFRNHVTCTILMAEHSQTSETKDIYCGTWQKVLCPTEILPPKFFWHPLWVPYAFCRISAASFHIALPGDIVIIVDAFPHRQRL